MGFNDFELIFIKELLPEWAKCIGWHTKFVLNYRWVKHNYPFLRWGWGIQWAFFYMYMFDRILSLDSSQLGQAACMYSGSKDYI